MILPYKMSHGYVSSRGQMAPINIQYKIVGTMEIQQFPLSEEQAIEKLKEQIEFYFSLANLAADEALKSQMEKTSKRWVSLQYLLRCHKVQQIIDRSTLRKANKAVHLKLIENAVRVSQLLKYHEGRVKHVKRIKYKQDFKRVVYLERKEDFDLNVLESVLEHGNMGIGDVNVSWKRECCFVQFLQMTEEEVNERLKEISRFCRQENITLLTWSQIQEVEARYQALLGPLSTKRSKEKSKKIKKKKKPRRPEVPSLNPLSLAEKRQKRKEKFEPLLRNRRLQKLNQQTEAMEIQRFE